MTVPRQILPGTTYLVTRRCAQRQFLLRPSRETNEIFAYVLGVAARRFGIHVHAYCVLSNHFHLVVTDPGARLPAFAQYLESLVARAVNASLGRWEAFWAPSSYSAVVLATPDDALAKSAYVLANPVAAGLVRRGREWPGLWSAPERLGSPALVARRPKAFFRSSGPMPESVELELRPPPGLALGEFRRRLFEEVASLEDAAARALAAIGRGFMGVSKVLAQRPSAHPVAGETRRTMNPRAAATDKWKRIETLSRLVEFLARYRAAWGQRRAGEQGFLFPAGTYLLRVMHGVPCAAPG